MHTTHYIWDYANDSYLMEKDENGATTAIYTNEPVQYGNLISQRRGSTTSYYHFDGQGSTRQMTHQNGDVTDEYAYSAFGEPVATSGATTNPFEYMGARGYYTDDAVGGIYVRARMYSTTLGRWLSRDPIGLAGGPNVYGYVSNNPILASDPSGLQVGWACLACLLGGFEVYVSSIAGSVVCLACAVPLTLVNATKGLGGGPAAILGAALLCCPGCAGIVQHIRRYGNGDFVQGVRDLLDDVWRDCESCGDEILG